MRESRVQRTGATLDQSERIGAAVLAAEVAHEPDFFRSFYKATVGETLDDRRTIGGVSEMEARFHYNAIENSIINALAKIVPPPPTQLVEAWRILKLREGLRALDIGSGAGHWIDFMRAVFHVSDVVGVELTEQVADILRRKYAKGSGVTILCADIAEPGFDVDAIGGPVDYATAIGVMFHIVNDERWERAIANIASALKPGGKLIVGGDFGLITQNRESVKTVQFSDWREFQRVQSQDAPREYVTRRVRALSHWLRVARAHGLEMIDLVRSQNNPNISTPENDVLLLVRE